MSNNNNNNNICNRFFDVFTQSYNALNEYIKILHDDLVKLREEIKNIGSLERKMDINETKREASDKNLENILIRIEKLLNEISEIDKDIKKINEILNERIRNDIKSIKDKVEKYEHLYKWGAIIVAIITIAGAFLKALLDIVSK
jgi:DNA repair exonuclease SbcCD ATPase subunit